MPKRKVIAVVQAAAGSQAWSGKRALMQNSVHAAAMQGEALMVFPELYLSGYSFSLRCASQVAVDEADRLHDVQKMAKEYESWICCGYLEATEGCFYNSAVLINPAGEMVCNYRKIHLYGADEPRVFTAGEKLALCDTPFGRIGLAICYDIEQRDMGRDLRAQGAEIILTPTANMAPHHDVPENHVRQRAIENAVTVAYANYFGRDAHLDFIGGSLIAGPRGETLGQQGAGVGIGITQMPERFKKDM